MEMFAILQNIHHTPPKRMGYPWEGGWTENQRPIHFEDALGRSVRLPPVLCVDKKVWLKLYGRLLFS